jgi:hypothetical protein
MKVSEDQNYLRFSLDLYNVTRRRGMAFQTAFWNENMSWKYASPT